MADIKKTHELIHNLVECCRDSQQIYLEAAEHVSESRLRHYFNERSLERAQFAGDLTQELRRLGEHDLKISGTSGGTVRRAWLETKAKLGGGDHAILTSLESCEDHIKHAYEEAMKSGLTSDLDALVRTQAQSIYTAHDYIRNIRDRKAAA